MEPGLCSYMGGMCYVYTSRLGYGGATRCGVHATHDNQSAAVTLFRDSMWWHSMRVIAIIHEAGEGTGGGRFED